MSERDEIPADILETARELALDWAMPETEETCAASIAQALLAERERCAAFAYAKHDWPPRWIAAAFRGESSAYTDFEP